MSGSSINTWAALAQYFDGDSLLARADAIFERPASAAGGKHNTGGKLSGEELLAAHGRGERLFLGRSGGLDGELMRHDAASGQWRTQRYETNREATEAPNRNWFSLEDFARIVGELEEVVRESKP